MRAFFRFFVDLVTKDPWRKLGSVGLALVLWGYIHQRITSEREYTLEIRPTRLNSWESDPGFLYVKVPAGYTLPLLPGNRFFIVRLKGTNHELDSLSLPLTGFIDPGEKKEEGQADRIGISKDQIRWEQRQVAGLVQSLFPDPFFLTFEPIERHEIVLQPEQLDLQGSPPDGFAEHPGEARFHPTNVLVVSGPHRMIEKLRRGEFGRLFQPLVLRKDDTRDPQSFLLELREPLKKEGIEIESRSALVASIPIRPKTLTLNFKARIHPFPTGERAKSLGEQYRLQGSSENSDWVEENWVAEIPGTLASEITASWIQKNVRFFVDLGSIPESPEEISSVALDVFHQILLPDSERARVAGIRFRPADPARAKVTVEKKTPSPPKGS